MKIDNKFFIGDTVYLVTDKEQQKRIVTGIMVRPTILLYELSHNADASIHYDFEISATEDTLTKVK